jgi:Asp-tRNA(Asn)/Glu-tRNA(Gln) amidotransferase B subunit
LIQSGQKVQRQTLYYDSVNHKTVVMRSKEDETDYRYMPEPDLPPLRISPVIFFVDDINLWKLGTNRFDKEISSRFTTTN